MMRLQSLRAKLTLANILPILVLMPLLNLYLLYVLEQFYTQKLLDRLLDQARLVQAQVEQQPALIDDAQAAQAYLTHLAGLTNARMVLLSPEGTMLGASRPEELLYVGSQFDLPREGVQREGVQRDGVQRDGVQRIEQALWAGEGEEMGSGLTREVAFVALPIRQGGEIRGTMRLSYEVADVRAQFNQLRGLLFGGIGVTLLLAVVVGLGLATTITRPLRRLTHHAQEVAAGKYDVRVSLHRQDEVGVLADALNRMAAKLEESQAARRRQLAAIVHELSRPLAGLHAAVETLLDEDGVDPEVSRRLLSGIADELSRLERLTDSLHNLDRRRLQPLQLQRSRVDLGRIVRAGVAMFEPRAMQMEIALSAALPVDLPELEADEDRLIQVLTNLLDNAIKFTPRNGTIQVTVMEQADAVSVTVANSGEGISPTELPQLFQQFYRGDESRPPEKRGMGLGLTLCQEIINAHGGRIWVESRQGDGAQVSFTLPTLSPRICSVAAQPQPDRRLAPTQG